MKCKKVIWTIIWSLTKKNVGKTMSAKLLSGVFCQNYKDWMHHYVIVKLKSTQYSNYNIGPNKILIIKHTFPVQMYFIKCNRQSSWKLIWYWYVVYNYRIWLNLHINNYPCFDNMTMSEKKKRSWLRMK